MGGTELHSPTSPSLNMDCVLSSQLFELSAWPARCIFSIKPCNRVYHSSLFTSELFSCTETRTWFSWTARCIFSIYYFLQGDKNLSHHLH